MAWEAVARVRAANPLVQCITNFVSMDFMANTLLAAGASPAMVHAEEEIGEFTALADALCINAGTLTRDWLESMKSAAARARQMNKPWVLDPVGAGATSFRTSACVHLLGLSPAVVRGNASEILALAAAALKNVGGYRMNPAEFGAAEEGDTNLTKDLAADREPISASVNAAREPVSSNAKAVEGEKPISTKKGDTPITAKGVDSVHQSTEALEAAKQLAKQYRCVVAVSGAVDLVTDGERVVGVSNGVAMLQKITASGCSVTALIAAFAAVFSPEMHLEAAAYALAVFGLAGEIGLTKSSGPASLRLHLIDALHGLDQAAVSKHVKISEFSQT